MNNQQNNKPFRKGAAIIVIDKENNFLLIQKNGYKDNEWSFPGGGREEGEILEQNMYRELKEEINTYTTDLEIVGISTHKIEYDYPAELALKVNDGKFRGQSYDQVVVRFIGSKDQLIFTPKEFRGHKWVSANELITYLVFPNQYQNNKKAIDEVLPGLMKEVELYI
ncbi:MAG: NUDIX domain-containing protein [Candidatus Roizmanbacteria bacterium]